MSSVRIHDQFEEPIEALVPSKYPSKSAVVFEALRQFFEKGDEPDLVKALMEECYFIPLVPSRTDRHFKEFGGEWWSDWFSGIPLTDWSILGLVYVPAPDEPMDLPGCLDSVRIGGGANLINEGTPLKWFSSRYLEGQRSYSLTQKLLAGSPPVVLSYPNRLVVRGKEGQDPVPQGRFFLEVRRRALSVEPLAQLSSHGHLPTEPGSGLYAAAGDPLFVGRQQRGPFPLFPR